MHILSFWLLNRPAAGGLATKGANSLSVFKVRSAHAVPYQSRPGASRSTRGTSGTEARILVFSSGPSGGMRNDSGALGGAS